MSLDQVLKSVSGCKQRCDRSELPAKPTGMDFIEAGAEITYLDVVGAMHLARRILEAINAAATAEDLQQFSLGDHQLLQAVAR